MSVKIGVVFCDNCKNNHCEALNAYDAIKEHFDHDIFLEDFESTSADLWLLICGCTNPCLEHEHLDSPFGKLFVMGKHDIPKAIHMIEIIKENKDMVDNK